MTMRLLVECALSAMLANNIVLTRFLGLCPAIGTARGALNALGMGMAVMVVMTGASAICWFLDRVALVPNSLTALRLLVFMLTIGGFVQVLELSLRKWNARLCDAWGIYLPLLASNCAILGIVLITALSINPRTGNPFSFTEMLAYSFFTGAGFTLVSLLMAGITVRLRSAPVAAALRGLPLALLSLGLVALAFCGFAGLVVGGF